MNELILENSNKNIKRFFTLDNRAYKSGFLDKKNERIIRLSCLNSFKM
jgi:hypothetical protein